MVNESAPTLDMIAVVTYAFMPWMSDTTVTIDVTATMLPSTVMNDRSLFAQMAWSAILTDSKSFCTGVGRIFRSGAMDSRWAASEDAAYVLGFRPAALAARFLD